MAININNLSKKYSKKEYALKDINLHIEKGMFGLLGQNGAGKTTLMRIITTLIEPTKGVVNINGIELKKSNYIKIKCKIGYLPQEFGIYPNLTVYEALDYLGILYKIASNKRQRKVQEIIEKVNLTKERNKKIKHLSGGMKQRVGIGQALLNSPEILVIDEPTAGLDPTERIRIRKMLNQVARDKIVILSTHIVEDIASTCNKLAILDCGKIKYSGDISGLIQQVKGKVWNCKVKNPGDLEKISDKYIVLSNIYTQDQIEARIVSESKPHKNAENSDPGIEDAYIYLIGKGERNE